MFLSEYVAVHTFHLDRVPYNRMTLVENDDFADMGIFPLRFEHFGTPSFFDKQWGSEYLYPAPLALIYRLFYFSANSTNWYLGAVSFLFVVAGVLLFRALRKRGLDFDSSLVFAATSVLFSYPMYFTLNRANLEFFVWVFSAIGVLCFLKDKPWLSALFLGIAGGCKIYPFFYLGLFLVRKKIWQPVCALAVGVVLNIISMYAVAGNFAAGRKGISNGLESFRQTYVLHRRCLESGLDHSIFGFIKGAMTHVPHPERLATILSIYLAIAGTLALLVFFLRVRKLPVINQVLFITVACITLPPLSSDYTLLHLYTAWIMLVMFAVDAWLRAGSTPRGLWPITACMAVLLSSQTEIILHGERLNGQIKCIALLSLGTLAATIPLQNDEPLLEAQIA